MVKHHVVDGYDAFCKFVENMETKDDPYYFLYTGSKSQSGDSWCPDCVIADPVIEKTVLKAPENAHFVTVFVGDRPTWKDSNCMFRKDARTKLMVIPTLVKWKGPQKLEAEKCAKEELVEMMFTDFDD